MSGYLCGPTPLGYLDAHEDAIKRLRNGERQTLCTVCKRWQWRDEECGHDGPRVTEKAWKAQMKKEANREGEDREGRAAVRGRGPGGEPG